MDPGGSAFAKGKSRFAPPKMLRNQFRRMSSAEVGRIMKGGRLAEGAVRVLRNDETDILSGTSPKTLEFEALSSQGCYVGTYPTKQQARRALERAPVRCVNQLPPSPPPRLPLLPARLELGLGLVQRRRVIRGAQGFSAARCVQRPEPAQIGGACAGLIDAADARVAAEHAKIEIVLVDGGQGRWGAS